MDYIHIPCVCSPYTSLTFYLDKQLTGEITAQSKLVSIPQCFKQSVPILELPTRAKGGGYKIIAVGTIVNFTQL